MPLRLWERSLVSEMVLRAKFLDYLDLIQRLKSLLSSSFAKIVRMKPQFDRSRDLNLSFLRQFRPISVPSIQPYSSCPSSWQL